MAFTPALWTPSQQRVEQSNMTAFQKYCRDLTGRSMDTYDDLYQWSIRDMNSFWAAAAEFLDIEWIEEPSRGARTQKGTSMLDAEWFPEATLNFAQNLLPPPSEHQVLVAYAEGMPVRRYSARELYREVTGCAASLMRAGVVPGDRVAGILGNGPEAIIAMLATAACGAVWASCSPDFGTSGVYDRLSQINPRVVFLAGQYRYNGKPVDCKKTLQAAVEQLASKPTTIVVDPIDAAADEFVAFCKLPNDANAKLQFVPRHFDDPQFILFSSGTTGLPKCIVHGVGGTLLQHKKELALHSDVKSGDTLFFFTTCGWMMWNWMASALACGAKIVLFDGSPSYPNMQPLWDVCRAEGVTHFGTSPKFLSACMAIQGFSPDQGGPLPRLRTMLCTGSPLLPQHFEWVYKYFPDIHLASISGGTDIVSCFMLGNPNLPVFTGEIQCRGLGMAVEAWTAAGEAVEQQKAELVCTKPFVSMPVCFWNDPDRAKYRRAYFEYFPRGIDFSDVWRHGDFIEVTAQQGVIVYGRSDATLNPGGVRIGTAEIYRTVESMPSIADSVAVGQVKGEDSRVILFVKLAPGVQWTQLVEQDIRSRIRRELTPRHVPAVILPVADIPYTRSGKKMEIAVTQAIDGQEVPNLSAIANPESLNEFRHWIDHLKRT